MTVRGMDVRRVPFTVRVLVLCVAATAWPGRAARCDTAVHEIHIEVDPGARALQPWIASQRLDLTGAMRLLGAAGDPDGSSVRVWRCDKRGEAIQRLATQFDVESASPLIGVVSWSVAALEKEKPARNGAKYLDGTPRGGTIAYLDNYMPYIDEVSVPLGQYDTNDSNFTHIRDVVYHDYVTGLGFALRGRPLVPFIGSLFITGAPGPTGLRNDGRMSPSPEVATNPVRRLPILPEGLDTNVYHLRAFNVSVHMAEGAFVRIPDEASS